MKLGLILAIIIGGAVLIVYTLIERRINQRACPECGFRLSVDAPDDECPRCGSIISSEEALAPREVEGR